MPIINITPADLAKIKVLEPGIYTGTVIKVYGLETAKSGMSTNQKIDVEIEGQGGKVISVTFNSIMIAKLVPLIEAAEGKNFVPGQYDTDKLQGKKVDVKVGSRTYEGNLLNEITDFYPAGRGKDMNQVPFG